MEQCREYLVIDPEAQRGNWRRDGRPLALEIGCGKGSFTCRLAEEMPETDLVAIEKVPDAMVLAMEKAKTTGLNNVRFLEYDAAGLRAIFAPGEIDRIYINFCDPWPKSRDAKFRLTAPAFLRIYADLLPEGGEIVFKTDNLALFDWSLKQFSEEKWIIRSVERDLHAEGAVGILTDYELKFMQEGIPIKKLVAVRGAETLNGAAGEPPRLRDAALADAWGNQEVQRK